jgi:hypothetical protein
MCDFDHLAQKLVVAIGRDAAVPALSGAAVPALSNEDFVAPRAIERMRQC